MSQILGLGGIFIRCKDVDRYRAWWSDHMGVALTDWGTLEWEHSARAYPSRSMLSPFAANTPYFDPSTQSVMINLRTDDVRGMIEKARKGGAQIVGEIDDTEYGMFGWFIDPEGYKIELWQEPSG
ncbi:VOC family protein [Litorimonas sp. RW-G-Af-16]|uniref:VOC family protein n=1 Tax=Litorimonas sp. RW-G-Af-16 TaxID=3241168 RepID=UPI00390C8E99